MKQRQTSLVVGGGGIIHDVLLGVLLLSVLLREEAANKVGMFSHYGDSMVDHHH